MKHISWILYTRDFAHSLVMQNIDTEAEPETAVKYGVFTLPTTILIDQQGDVREINYGLTHTEKLTKQVAKIVNGELYEQ